MTNLELQSIRKALKLTQAALAEQLEVTPNTVARWEMEANRGRYPVPKWVSREVNRLLTDRRTHLGPELVSQYTITIPPEDRRTHLDEMTETPQDGG